jgi:hypothetical protein
MTMPAGEIFRSFRKEETAMPVLMPMGYHAIASAMLRHLNIHEGHWQVYMKFERSGQVAEWRGVYVPTCVIGVTEMGLMKVERPTPLSVCAPDVWNAPASYAPTIVDEPDVPQ